MMQKVKITVMRYTALLLLSLGALRVVATETVGSCVLHDRYDIAAYVWPAYQPEPRWAELGIFKAGKGEWQNVWEAVPKWEGHRQPLKPLWGYENEADPKVVEKKINAAIAHGVPACGLYQRRGFVVYFAACQGGLTSAGRASRRNITCFRRPSGCRMYGRSSGKSSVSSSTPRGSAARPPRFVH
ncbi:MAG: hypothetical protein IJ658_13305 [Kiritimatiellae bacterium]|nr:hypothetical protein [Kiritimatiellia bacterium]